MRLSRTKSGGLGLALIGAMNKILRGELSLYLVLSVL